MTDWGALFRLHAPFDTTDTIDRTPNAAGSVNYVDCVEPITHREFGRSPLTYADVADLRDRYTQRAAISEFDGGEDRAREEARAWHEVAAIWYRRHGRRVPGDTCAGCGQPLDREPDLYLLPHGERAHADAGCNCVLAYGRRWKAEAARALVTIGIPTPEDVARDIGNAALLSGVRGQ